MNSQPHGFEDLQDRLLKLEKQNRRFKQLGAAILIVFASFVIMGQAPPKEKTVEANEFVLRDDNGNIRAKLFMTKKITTEAAVIGDATVPPKTIYPFPMLSLYDDKGKPTISLSQDSIHIGYLGLKYAELTYNALKVLDDKHIAIVSPENLVLLEPSTGRVWTAGPEPVPKP